MNHKRRILIGPFVAVPVLAVALAGCGGSDSTSSSASARPPEPASGRAAVDVAESSLGKILVGANRRTLYVFEKDTGSKSACFGACARVWPPFRTKGKPVVDAAAAMALVATIARSDGAPEVTYDGQPLYYYAGDESGGDTNGEGLSDFGGRWYAVSPSGKPVVGDGSGY
jgi:predicted lipoprotein with Yx(FWY)xxD motif